MAASLAAMLSNALTFGAPGTASWPTQPMLEEPAQLAAVRSCSALCGAATPLAAVSAVAFAPDRCAQHVVVTTECTSLPSLKLCRHTQ